MSHVVITATREGFHNLSPLGLALAPNVFLQTAVNLDGTIVGQDGEWKTAEGLSYDDFGISVTVDSDAYDAPKLGDQIEITVTELEFYRIENGERIVIGTLELPEPLVVTATYDQLGPDSYGWSADLGDNLEDIIQAEGYEFQGGDGNDVFNAHMSTIPVAGNNFIDGQGGHDSLVGGVGVDIIRGGTGNDYLYDPAGANKLRGENGNDWIEVGDGSQGSVLRGGYGRDVLISGKGDDKLLGNQGRDTLIGGRGDDFLDGGLSHDTLDGGNGEDILIGGRGHDILTGGEDADMFIFKVGDSGDDTITDFEDGLDMLVLEGASSMDDVTIIADGYDTMVSWDGGSVLLTDVDAQLISADDFTFA